MQQDPEISNLSKVCEILKPLNKAQIYRIIQWIEDRYEINDNPPEPEPAIEQSTDEGTEADESNEIENK
ncbi:MAG: hypothetical protein ACM3SY_01300 [Candidatus Omnitrophota bacterium]